MIHLMIVDDEYKTRTSLKNHIPWESLGIQSVELAEDGEEALALAVCNPPKILITDIRMPRMDGIELAKKIKELYPTCKIIFLSGYSDKEYLKSAILLSAISYVEKPINLEEIKQAIRSAVALCHKNEEKKQSELLVSTTMSKAIIHLRQNLAVELTDSHLKANELFEKAKLSKLYLPLNTSYCTGVIILHDSEVMPFDQQYKNTFIEFLGNCFKLNIQSFLLGFKEETHIVFHLYHNDLYNSTYLNQILETVLNCIKDEWDDQLRVFIGVGKVVSSLEDILESYRTAVIASQKLFYQGFGRIIFYQANEDKEYDFNEQILSDFQVVLEEKSREEAIHFIEKLNLKIKQYDNTLINHVKTLYYKLTYQLINTLDSRILNSSAVKKQDEMNYFEKIYHLPTLDDIKSTLLEEIDHYYLLVSERTTKSKSIQEIIEYIHNNYFDEHLSIQKISDYVFFNPIYLCALFKKETGKTINQYITQYRVEQAKNLLRDRRTKLFKISANIGYTDANYFTRIFKKATGLTPSEYREKFLL